jgi:integrase/recombinase XerD
LKMGGEMVVVPKVRLPVEPAEKAGVLAIMEAAGAAAMFAWDEFFSGQIRNGHTRVAYLRNVRRFLARCQERKVELGRVTPGLVGKYLDELKGSPSTKKQILAAIRKFFEKLVLPHAIL